MVQETKNDNNFDLYLLVFNFLQKKIESIIRSHTLFLTFKIKTTIDCLTIYI